MKRTVTIELVRDPDSETVEEFLSLNVLDVMALGTIIHEDFEGSGCEDIGSRMDN